MSFVAIQQLELDQLAGPGKDKRSLREIQEEEKSLQEEADFLKWWTAEEARVRVETEAAIAAADSQQNRAKQPGKRHGKKQEQNGDAPSSSKPYRPRQAPRKPSQQVKISS